jgi:hypothetical protein
MPCLLTRVGALSLLVAGTAAAQAPELSYRIRSTDPSVRTIGLIVPATSQSTTWHLSADEISIRGDTVVVTAPAELSFTGATFDFELRARPGAAPFAVDAFFASEMAASPAATATGTTIRFRRQVGDSSVAMTADGISRRP